MRRPISRVKRRWTRTRYREPKSSEMTSFSKWMEEWSASLPRGDKETFGKEHNELDIVSVYYIFSNESVTEQKYLNFLVMLETCRETMDSYHMASVASSGIGWGITDQHNSQEHESKTC